MHQTIGGRVPCHGCEQLLIDIMLLYILNGYIISSDMHTMVNGRHIDVCMK